MGQDPLTDEEHETRAMLLGWRYIPAHGYYINYDEYDPTAGKGLNMYRRYDAITMEPLDRLEVIRRTDEAFKERYYDRAIR